MKCVPTQKQGNSFNLLQVQEARAWIIYTECENKSHAFQLISNIFKIVYW